MDSSRIPPEGLRIEIYRIPVEEIYFLDLTWHPLIFYSNSFLKSVFKKITSQQEVLLSDLFKKLFSVKHF